MIKSFSASREDQTKQLRTVPVIAFDYHSSEGPTLVVWTEWQGAKLDRPITHGINFGPVTERRSWTLARRYALAINAQVTERDVSLAKDNADKTYVRSTCKIHGKYANRDLTQLGF